MTTSNTQPNHHDASESGMNEAYLKIAQDWSLWEEPLDLAVARLTEIVSQSLNVSRVSIWLADKDLSVLLLKDLYCHDNSQHSNSLSISRADYPVYFSVLARDRVMDAVDACHDPRTIEFSQNYLKPLGIVSMLDATLRTAGRLAGVLCVEHIGCQRVWSEQEKRFAVSVADLLSQRLIYEEIRRNGQYYQQLSSFQKAIFDSTNYSIISTDTYGVIQTFNAAAQRMLGYEQEEVIGKLTPQIFHDVDEVIRRAQSLSAELGEKIKPGFDVFVAKARHGIAEEREWTYVRKDGFTFPVRLSITALQDENGNVNGYLGIASDISDQVKTRDALRENEARYRVLFERAGDSILLLENGVFVDCNEATLKIFGCTREQIIGQIPSRFSPEYQPDGRISRDKAIEKISRAMQGETQFFEWQHSRYDGTVFDAEVTLNVVIINHQSMLFGVVRDVTDRKQAEQELIKSRQALLDKNASLKVIYDLSNKLHGSLEIDSIVRETLGVVRGMSREPSIAIYLFEHHDEVPRLKLAASYGFDEETKRAGAYLTMEGSLSGYALDQGRIIFSSRIEDEHRADPAVRKMLAARHLNVAVVVPLMYQENRLGCINLMYPQDADDTKIDIETLEAIGKTVSLALSNAAHMHDMQYMAQHDSLTDLPNRLHLHQALGLSIQQEKIQYAALLLIDLDRFKEINDTLGHHVGDLLLQQIGPRMNAVLEGCNATICRLGGDEFTILIKGKQAIEIDVMVRKVLAALREPMPIGEMLLEIDASIGVAVYPTDGADSHSLLRSADVAMYEAKRKGCGYVMYAESMDTHSPERLVMMAELGDAIRQGQLMLHYQPKINLADNHIYGFEALVRWQHPKMGLLYPDKFIPMAEVAEAIHHLTAEVLDIALKQQSAWLAAGMRYSVAVNLSARNLMDNRFFNILCVLLEKYRAPAELLELEITETALMQDPEGAVELLKKISELGVKLSIDDFGTGYSSLSYLRRLPIDALKIDLVFVRDMLQNEQDEIIVRSTISLAHNLKIKVVAEGVEDAETMKRLKTMGCDLAQGYHISKPVAWDEIVKWINKVEKPGVEN